jgi:hypothetical protein
MYDSHPTFSERLLFFDTNRVKLSGAKGYFSGVDKNNQELVKVKIIGIFKSTEETLLYLIIETTDLLNNNIKIYYQSGDDHWGIISDANGNQFGFNSNYNYTIPPSSMNIIETKLNLSESKFMISDFEKIDISSIKSFKMNAGKEVKSLIFKNNLQ